VYTGVIGSKLIVAAIKDIVNCATFWKDQGKVHPSTRHKSPEGE
jgi:hypothetical protein